MRLLRNRPANAAGCSILCPSVSAVGLGAGNGQPQPVVGQPPAVLRADRAGVAAIRGCGQYHAHGAAPPGGSC